jgi:hypothetical protein
MFSKLQKNIACIKGRFIKSLVFMTPALLAFQNASAQLPRPVDPSSGPTNGNYLGFMQGWTVHWRYPAQDSFGFPGSCCRSSTKHGNRTTLIGVQSV